MVCIRIYREVLYCILSSLMLYSIVYSAESRARIVIFYRSNERRGRRDIEMAICQKSNGSQWEGEKRERKEGGGGR